MLVKLNKETNFPLLVKTYLMLPKLPHDDQTNSPRKLKVKYKMNLWKLYFKYKKGKSNVKWQHPLAT